MCILSDAPRQTCKQLWIYVSSVVKCVVEKKKLAITSSNSSIVFFPNLLHHHIIYLTQLHKWDLKMRNDRNNHLKNGDIIESYWAN